MICWFLTISTAILLTIPYFVPRSVFLMKYESVGSMPAIFVGAGYLAFLIGYLLGRPFPLMSRVVKATSAAPNEIVRSKYMIALTLWSMVGLTVTVLMITHTMSLSDYLIQVGLGGRYAEEARLQTVQLPANRGGLPGVVKMLTQNCTASLVILLNLIIIKKQLRTFINRFCAGTITLFFLARTFLMIDRLAFLLMLPLLVQLAANASRRRRFVVALVIGAILLLSEMQSLRRGYSLGVLGFLIHYVQSGMINLHFMMASFNGVPTFGLMTVFAPVFYLFRAFGMDLYLEGDGYAWGWNYFQNAYGYFYHDFLWATPVVLVVMGILCGRMDQASAASAVATKGWRELARFRTKALLSFAALSFISVPAFYGIDFYLIFCSVLLATCCEWHYRRSLFVIVGRGGTTFVPVRNRSYSILRAS